MSSIPPSGLAHGRRQALRAARVMLIFTPELCEDPRACLREVWSHVDVIQIRPKPLGPGGQAPAEARLTLQWCETALEIGNALPGPRPLLLVNDRVDVAASLIEDGIDGVHLGQEDTPPAVAREELGANALIGLSTHDYDEVRLAEESPVDYLGFGAVFPTQTKAVTTPNHSVHSWVASSSTGRPVFPIGGIHTENAWQLAPVGRAAVGAGILQHPNPAEAAQIIRRSLRPRGPQSRRATP